MKMLEEEKGKTKERAYAFCLFLPLNVVDLPKTNKPLYEQKIERVATKILLQIMSSTKPIQPNASEFAW